MGALMRQNDDYQKALRKSTEEKLNDMGYQLNVFGDKYNAKLYNVSYYRTTTTKIIR